MEQEDEMLTGGYDTPFRKYNAKIGRWLSNDPLVVEYPSHSPYNAFNGNPIYFKDPSGAASDGSPGFRSKDVEEEDDQETLDLDLSYDGLVNNPDYDFYSIVDLRMGVQMALNRYNIDVPYDQQWRKNVHAGVALENMFWVFMNFHPTKEFKFNHKKFETTVRSKDVKPDFITGVRKVELTGKGGIPKVKPTIASESHFWEVKASQNTIGPDFSNKQIEGEIEAVSKTTGFFGGQVGDGIPQYTLVVPGNGLIDEEALIEVGDKYGVEIGVSYAFRNIHTGLVVFSKPKALNSVEDEYIETQSLAWPSLGSKHGVSPRTSITLASKIWGNNSLIYLRFLKEYFNDEFGDGVEFLSD